MIYDNLFVSEKLFNGSSAVADPGFTVGGAWTRQGGRGPPMWVLCGKNDVKTKEFGPVGGGACAPRSANDQSRNSHFNVMFDESVF